MSRAAAAGQGVSGAGRAVGGDRNKSQSLVWLWGYNRGETMPNDYTLTDAQRRWADKRRRQGASTKEQAALLKAQQGRCKLSGVLLRLDPGDGAPQRGGLGCHPLYPAVDHKDPGNPHGGYQIICYALNDLKGHMPVECFEALCKTRAWKELMQRWRVQAEKNSNDREVFRLLIRPNAVPK